MNSLFLYFSQLPSMRIESMRHHRNYIHMVNYFSSLSGFTYFLWLFCIRCDFLSNLLDVSLFFSFLPQPFPGFLKAMGNSERYFINLRRCACGFFYFNKSLTKFTLVDSSVKKTEIKSHDNSFIWCRRFTCTHTDTHDEAYSRFLQLFFRYA
jgi:hypothetical protein